MATRFGAFALGFATGALTVVGFQKLKEYAESEDYEQLAETVQDNLHELEARIFDSSDEHTSKLRKAKVKKTA